MLRHSLAGAALVGCGAGSGCDAVTGSVWAYFLGNIPVSLPALLAYVIMLICILFYGGKSREAQSLDGKIELVLLLLAGAITGSAIWFSWLQIGVLHSFCKYCTLLHLIGCAASVLILIHCRHLRAPIFIAGIAAAGIFSFVQTKTLPDSLYDSGRTESSLPSFSAEEAYTIGPEDPNATLTLLFDFQCSHCRRMHRLLPEVCENLGINVRLCPVPLSSGCNPYVPDGIDVFDGSCPITRTALAVWFARPDLYRDFEEFLMGPELCPSPDETYAEAARILGKEELDAAMQDKRIDNYLSKVYELFGRTSTAGKGAVPRLICNQEWLVAEVDDEESLSSLIREKFMDL